MQILGPLLKALMGQLRLAGLPCSRNCWRCSGRSVTTGSGAGPSGSARFFVEAVAAQQSPAQRLRRRHLQPGVAHSEGSDTAVPPQPVGRTMGGLRLFNGLHWVYAGMPVV